MRGTDKNKVLINIRTIQTKIKNTLITTLPLIPLISLKNTPNEKGFRLKGRYEGGGDGREELKILQWKKAFSSEGIG